MKVLFLFGTRPEAIKLAPVILAMRSDPFFDVTVCCTAQHRHMLDQVLQIFGINPDIDLNLMTPDQSLSSLTAKVIESVDNILKQVQPNLCMIQGDTTTVLSSALTCYYNHIPVAHVEAGLRTYNKKAPFPEEINRVLATHICDFHFAPTERAKDNLLRDNIPLEKILVTGNTIIDSLNLAVKKIDNKEIAVRADVDAFLRMNQKFVLITSHRRENFGEGIENICSAIKDIATAYPSFNLIFPVHLNPNIKAPVYDILRDIDNIYLLEPLDYISFVALMRGCYLILTDSGGIQEEASAFGKPVLVMRDATERPEAIEAGLSKLVGTNRENIIEELSVLIEDKDRYLSMSKGINPFGDGRATERIVSFVKERA